MMVVLTGEGTAFLDRFPSDTMFDSPQSIWRDAPQCFHAPRAELLWICEELSDGDRMTGDNSPAHDVSIW
jgi:hypothetical protein